MHRTRRFILLCLLTSVLGCVAAPQALAQKGTANTTALVTLETRIAVDADSCPTAVEVWLTSSTDTIQALQLAIAWDRPDFARFKTVTLKKPAIDTLIAGDSAGAVAAKSDSAITVPVLDRENGLLKDWEYVEARGEHGLAVRITAFPYLATKGNADPLLPADSGLLISLPVEILPKPPVDVLGDSATVSLTPEGVRLSDTWGKLIKNITLRSQSIRAATCWSGHKNR